MNRRWEITGILVIIVVLTSLMLSGCGGSDASTPGARPYGQPASRDDVIGDWTLGVFWSSSQGAITLQEYFDEPALHRVTASFRADGTFSMDLLDESRNRLGTIEGTWEMARLGTLVIHWPDRTVEYTVKLARGWLWTSSVEMGYEIRLYFV